MRVMPVAWYSATRSKPLDDGREGDLRGAGIVGVPLLSRT
jgi:hypothetical protein